MIVSLALNLFDTSGSLITFPVSSLQPIASSLTALCIESESAVVINCDVFSCLQNLQMLTLLKCLNVPEARRTFLKLPRTLRRLTFEIPGAGSPLCPVLNLFTQLESLCCAPGPHKISEISAAESNFGPPAFTSLTNLTELVWNYKISGAQPLDALHRFSRLTRL